MLEFLKKYFQKDKARIESLEAENKLLKTAFWHLPHISFVRDNTGKFVLVNQNFARNFKASKMEDIIGKTDFDFNPNKEQVEKIQKQDRDIMASKEKFLPPITKYLDKEGKATYLETIKTPIIEEDNSSSNILGFSMNVTEKMELQNRAQEAMNKLLEAVTDVTSKIEDILKQASSVVSSTKKQSDNLSFLTDIAHQIIESNAESIQMMSAVLYIVTNTSDIADKGNQYLDLMLQSMQKIQENAKQMQSIIEIIDSIADQTNLLSLNASIESARAGSAGLGFTVVAREISKLAEKSADSTKGINALVKQTNSMIQKGNENVTEGGETFKKIISEVGNIDKLVNSVDETMKGQIEIYNTFREKIEQINDEATQINHITTEQMNNVNSVMASINQLNRDFINLLTVQNTNGK